MGRPLHMPVPLVGGTTGPKAAYQMIINFSLVIAMFFYIKPFLQCRSVNTKCQNLILGDVCICAGVLILTLFFAAS